MDYNVRLWDVGSGTERGQLNGHSSSFTGLAFTKDGTILGSAAYGDDSIRLWDMATGVELA